MAEQRVATNQRVGAQGAAQAGSTLLAPTDRAWISRLGLLYVALSLAIVFTLDRYWSANWDVGIITDATRSLWDGGSPFDLYERSRATWPWPFPYPPHAALLLVPFIGLADLLSGTTSTLGPLHLVAIRLPVFAADVAIAWLLHRILWRATGERWVARLGALLWLFNPVLFYHTAVQGHQESTWMLPVLLAFEWLQERGLARAWWPTLLLVIAISLKQSALIYAAPYGLWLLWERRWRDVALFGLLFVLLFGGVSLPWALYSGDFKALVFDEVRRMPVQVQSWQLWALMADSFRQDQTRTTFPTVRYASLLVLGAATGLGGWAWRRGRSWYAIGLVATLCFVLFSQKVMAYHYPMVLPWLLAFALRPRRFRLAGLGWLWLAWVVVSPYFAPWSNPAHLPWYALLGTANSVVAAWLLWQGLASPEAPAKRATAGGVAQSARLVGWAVLLTVAYVGASAMQPLGQAVLRALADATPSARLLALLALLLALLLATLLLTPPLARWAERRVALPAAEARPARGWLGYGLGALLFVPLFFTWFTMSAEVTSVIERGIWDAWKLL